MPSLDCPVCEVDDYRIEVLIAMRKLERLDKDEFTEDERTDAEEVIEAKHTIWGPHFVTCLQVFNQRNPDTAAKTES